MLPKIYYINLDESIDRRLLMENSFSNQGFIPGQYERVPGVKHIKPHIGCCLAHIQAILKAYLDNNQYAIIMEDDLDLSDIGRLKEMVYQITLLDYDWDVIQIHYIEPNLLKALNSIDNKSNVLFKGYFMSAACYLINRKGMEKFVSFALDDSYNVKVDLTHPMCKSEELIYRYINSYTSLYPIINTLENKSSTIYNIQCYIDNNLNNMLEISKFNSKDMNYTFKLYYELPYDLHWFGSYDRAREFLSSLGF
jgi:GR25 family glycosyltransferase involved in LPS biosynthesis